MEHRLKIAGVLVFAVGCIAGHVVSIPPARADAPSRAKWEYLCMRVTTGLNDINVPQMNSAGSQGWELAAYHSDTNHLCFKRQLP